MFFSGSNTIEQNDLTSKLKPAAPASVHLFLAALLWSAIGVFLMAKGIRVLRVVEPLMAGGTAFLAFTIGWYKAKKILAPTALKSVARIKTRGDGRCVGGFLSWKSWLFVIAMALFGRYIRSAGLPPWLIGLILCAVGFALLRASAIFWQAYLKHVRR